MKGQEHARIESPPPQADQTLTGVLCSSHAHVLWEELWEDTRNEPFFWTEGLRPLTLSAAGTRILCLAKKKAKGKQGEGSDSPITIFSLLLSTWRSHIGSLCPHLTSTREH